MADATNLILCELCGEPYVTALHFCPQPAAPEGTAVRTIKFRCRCGGPVAFADPAWPHCAKCQQSCHECTCPDAVPVLAQGESNAVAPSDASPCHCVRLLPALRRWVETQNAYRAGSQVVRMAELIASTDALEALAREVCR